MKKQRPVNFPDCLKPANQTIIANYWQSWDVYDDFYNEVLKLLPGFVLRYKNKPVKWNYTILMSWEYQALLNFKLINQSVYIGNKITEISAFNDAKETFIEKKQKFNYAQKINNPYANG